MSDSEDEGLVVEEQIEGKRVRTLTEKGRNYYTSRKKIDYTRQTTVLQKVLATVRSELSEEPIREDSLLALKEDISTRLKAISVVVDEILELDTQQDLTAALTEITTSCHQAISDIVNHTKKETDQRIEQLSRSSMSRRKSTVPSTTSNASSARRRAVANVAAMKVKMEEGIKEDQMESQMLELEIRAKLLKAKKEVEESILEEQRQEDEQQLERQRQEEERQLKLKAEEVERRVKLKALQAEIELDMEKEKLKRQLKCTQQLTNLKAEEARANALESGSESSSRRSLSFLPANTAMASTSFDPHLSGLAASYKLEHSDQTTRLLDLIKQDVSSVRAVIGKELNQLSDVLIPERCLDVSSAAAIDSKQSQAISAGVTMSCNQTMQDFGYPQLYTDSMRNQVTTAGVTVTSKAMQHFGSLISSGNNLREIGYPTNSVVLSFLRPMAPTFSPNEPEVTYSFAHQTQNSSHQENNCEPTSLSNAQSAYQNSFVSRSANPFLSESRKDPATTRPESDVETLSKSLNAAIALSRLPPPEPLVFSGDHLLYPTWKASFSFLIESRGISPQEKMLYLQKYVGGVAREAIAGFFLLRDESAYLKALVVLEKRFGNSYAVSQAFRTKLDKWPIIKSKDVSGLRSFSDFLQQCLIASQEVGGLAILDDIHQIKKLVDKLPDWFSHRWNRYVASTKRDKQRYPLFREFTNFINDEAEIVSDPVFGTSTFATHPEALAENIRSQSNNKSRMTMSVCARCSKQDVNDTEVEAYSQARNFYQSNQEASVCSFCKRLNHDISKCRELMKKSWNERRDFIMKQGLCFGCLKSSEHRVKDCKERLTCTKCQKKHATCLHDDNFRFGRGTQVARNGNNGDSSEEPYVPVAQPAIDRSVSETGQPSQNTTILTATSHRIPSD
ncbi:hypothetical protein ACOMHN_008907 [Nucella lapillus]